MALLTKSFEYVGSDLLKTREAAARAAAVSAATSEPGVFASILNTLLGVSMSSGLSQQAWSFLASPTYKPKPTQTKPLKPKKTQHLARALRSQSTIHSDTILKFEFEPTQLQKPISS